MPKFAGINRSKIFSLYKKCVYCNSDENLTIEHVIPKVLAHQYKLSYRQINNSGNLVVACKKCNEEKANKPLHLFFLNNPMAKEMFKKNAKYVADYIKDKIKDI